MMKFDDMLRHVGEFGPYQKQLYLGICLPMAFHAIQTMSTIFTLAIPNHRCAIPGLVNDTYAVQGLSHEALIDQYIPRSDGGYSPCELYNTEHSVTTTLAERDVNTSSRATIKCQKWVYDTSVFYDTVITETNLVCSKSIYRAHATTAFFIGGFIALALVGAIADRFGRKVTSYVLILFMLISSHLMLWLPSIHAFIIFRLLTGLAFGTMFNLTFVYVMEFIGPSRRGTWGLFTNNFWGIGVVIQSGIAYGIRSWRYLQVAFSLPIIVCLAYWWRLPESPRWLLVKGHTDRGHAVLRVIAKGNGVELHDENIHTEAENEKKESGCSNLMLLLKHKSLLLRTLVVFWNWFAVAMLFYGVALNVSNLSGNLYLNFTISALMEICGYTLCIPLMTWLGRKRYHVTIMVIGGVCLLLTIVPELVGNESSRWIITALSMLGKLVASAAYATVYVLSAELFPTVIRGTVMSTSCNMATVGAAVSPYVVELTTLLDGHLGRIAPLLIFGATTLSAGLMALVLPETTGTNMPDNIEDMLPVQSTPLTTETEFEMKSA